MFHKINRFNRVLPGLAALFVFALLVVLYVSSGADSARPARDSKSVAALAQSILAERYCPCGCGNFLPGSSNLPACFGCSVGKAEITRVREGLAAGLIPEEIVEELNEKVLIDVFSDYTEDRALEVWNRVKRSAGAYNQRRVVFRALGASEEARRAIKLVECARAQGMFTIMHEALLDHQGPWDEATLIALATKEGLDRDKCAECLRRVDVAAQMAKDRQHAQLLNTNDFPAISVNRKLCPGNEDALRKAIRKVLIDGTI